MKSCLLRKARTPGRSVFCVRYAGAAVLAFGVLMMAVPSGGQVLARPGWAGSGVSVEPWWRRAVIYRIDPARFQDSNLDGEGDIAGITKRLDYLQSLGVDAILIDSEPAAAGKVVAPGGVSAEPGATAASPSVTPSEPSATSSEPSTVPREPSGESSGPSTTPPDPSSLPNPGGVEAESLAVPPETRATTPEHIPASGEPGAATSEPTAGAGPLPVDDGFDDLFRAAAAVHLRVLINAGVPARRTNVEDAAYLARARTWLSRGAAGLYVPTAELLDASSNEAAVYFVRQLRGLIDGMPGDHVLLADAAPDPSSALSDVVAKAAQMILKQPIELAPHGGQADGGQAEAAELRGQLANRLGDGVAGAGAGGDGLRAYGNTPVLRAARVDTGALEPEQAAGLRRTLALMLLGSRGAVMLDYGQELGLEPLEGGGNRAALMQWTPTNVTQLPAVAVPEETAAATGKETKFSAFKPYVKPLPRDLFAPPKLPEVVVSENPPPVDSNMLPGFTGGTRDARVEQELAARLRPLTAANAGSANVAMEQGDGHSLLTLYRRLIQLHHANASLRSGAEQIVDEDGAGALVWLRQPPPAANAGFVVAVCNMTSEPLEMPLSHIGPLRMKEARLRDLETAGDAQAAGALQASGRQSVVKVPAFGVALVAVEGEQMAAQAQGGRRGMRE